MERVNNQKFMSPVNMNLNDVYWASNTELMNVIGEKVKTIRLNINMTRDELQEASGVHKKTISDLENGKNVTLLTLIAVLRGLEELNLLERLLEDEIINPIALAELHGNIPKRASRKSLKGI